ncbi:hypothetical protein GCM10020000_02450 [Streptomyces olivoverticillatus]
MLACVPEGTRRLGATPHANGGLLLRELPIPALERFAVPVDKPGTTLHEPTRVLGGLLEAVMEATTERRDFRLVGPDETASNRLQAVYEATGKAWQAATVTTDEHLDRHGRVMEILSEHTCQGWLEGYLLTGRHGLFSCYEAFVHIVDSMVNQHVKWLRVTRRLPWRRPIASLNYLLTSHVWRQDHNGFSHQDPGFVDHILNKSPEAVRVYLPPGHQHPAGRGRPRAAQPRLRQRDRRGQAALLRLARPGTGPRPLHPGRRHLAVGGHGGRLARSRRRPRLRR